MSCRIKELARKGIAKLRIYEPGRPIEEVARELGFDPNEVVKVASNENELGPSPAAVEAMRRAAAEMHRYPDGGAFYLKRKLADRLGVRPENLLFGAGSNELIVFLCHVFLGPDRELVMGAEAFAVYFLAAALYGARTVRVPMPEHTHDLDALLAAVTPRTRIVAVVNPNNPTGTMVNPQALEQFVDRLPGNVVAVFDEAYYELMPEGERPDLLRFVREGRENVVVLRTFSKAYGLAGLRIGYAVGHPDLIDLLNKVRQPFNVNAMAQAAAMSALDDEAHLRRTRETVEAGREFLRREAECLGLEAFPSATNFVMIRVGRGREIFEAMQRRKVIVRPLDPYGLPEYIRITVGTEEQNRRVIAALREALEETGGTE